MFIMLSQPTCVVNQDEYNNYSHCIIRLLCVIMSYIYYLFFFFLFLPYRFVWWIKIKNKSRDDDLFKIIILIREIDSWDVFHEYRPTCMQEDANVACESQI